MTARVLVVLQARTDSRRLPGKALLPVAGRPSAVLAAMRAANRGHEVVLATTNRPVDDELAGVAHGAGISVFRGDADDVRRRFLDACIDLDGGDVVVRLTADNLFPDGDLVSRAVDVLCSADALIVRSMADPRLPYGLAVEAMRVGSLRASVDWRDDAYAREHVTPALLGRAGPVPRFIDLGADYGNLRCTLDTFDDLLVVQGLFAGTEDPVAVAWQELVARLLRHPESPPPSSPGPALMLGTAQLAKPYGTVSSTQPPSKDEAGRLVKRAARCRYGIDTAPAYGAAESVIGKALRGGDGSSIRVTTKLGGRPEACQESEAAEREAEISVLRSLLSLGDLATDVIVHRAEQRTAHGGAIWQVLRRMQREGHIGRIGVSVYTPDEAIEAVDDGSVQVLQLPFNLLDRRWLESGVVESLKGREDLIVQVRSVFLQGVLLRGAEAWPQGRGIDGESIRRELRRLVSELGRRSVADLCVSYVRGHAGLHGWVDAVVIGAETEEQLRSNEALFSLPALNEADIARVDRSFKDAPVGLLDPRHWHRSDP